LGVDYSLLSEQTYQAFLAISIITMGVTPFVINASYKPADFIVKKVSGTALGMKFVNGLYSESLAEEKIESGIKDHLIVVGYGFSGKTITKEL
jgi:CPA2 family monovalent cation:H+ antiporter-2